MKKDSAIGILILVGSVIGILTYGWLAFFSEWSVFVIQLTVFLIVVVLLAVIGWIGYALATTPSDGQIRDLETNPSYSQENAEKGVQELHKR